MQSGYQGGYKDYEDYGEEEETAFSGPYRGRHFRQPQKRETGEAAPAPAPRGKGRRISDYLLSIIQISVCVLVLLGAVVMKAVGGDAYAAVKNWYVTHISSSIIPQEKLDQAKENVFDLFPPSGSQSQPTGESSESSSPEQSSQQAESSAAGASSAAGESQASSPESASSTGSQP